VTVGLTGLLVVLVLVALVAGLTGTSVRAKAAAWREAARRLGVGGDAVREAGLTTPRFVATIDGFSVTVAAAARRSGDVGERIEVDGLGRISNRVELRVEDLGTEAQKAFRGPDVETGDTEFDRGVLVWGHPVLLSALLDAETRRRVRWFVESGGRVRGGAIVRAVDREIADPDGLVELVRETLALAGRLVDPADPVTRLAANAASDPLAEVRLRNLERLVERFPGRPETGTALHDALRDVDTRVRVWAASRLGEEGRAVLLEHAHAGCPDDEVVVTAVRGLGPELPVEGALDLLDHARDDGRVVVEAAAIEALGRLGHPAARARLVGLLRSDAGRFAAAEAARALAAAGDPAVEPHFLAALARGDAGLREVAVEALGRLGTVAAVAPLRTVAAAHPFDLALRRAVEAAIAAIQERATGAAPGQLALAGGEAGALTLSGGAAAGQVALASRRRAAGCESGDA
jgi:HEAT repeat protein